MSEKLDSKKGFTRRQILKGVPIGLAGAAVFSMVSGRVVSKFVRRSQMPNLPEDSIFAPDKSRYPQA
ncbi:MAG: hypothetical protein OXC95_00520 [Dehalococcoidia bacterium]|nr:hypothetical protein [Dehalococcoidia bacterium]